MSKICPHCGKELKSTFLYSAGGSEDELFVRACHPECGAEGPLVRVMPKDDESLKIDAEFFAEFHLLSGIFSVPKPEWH